jgi:hypothetical protein
MLDMRHRHRMLGILVLHKLFEPPDVQQSPPFDSLADCLTTIPSRCILCPAFTLAMPSCRSIDIPIHHPLRWRHGIFGRRRFRFHFHTANIIVLVVDADTVGMCGK